MKTNSTPDYSSKQADNSPEQRLSYFESHIDKYPDGPKRDEEMETLNLAPNPREFYEDEDENDVKDDSDYDSNLDGSDEDYEEGYKLLASNRDDFENSYENI
jgi:hypothetical protein